MFERFGEFDSFHEINKTAEGLKEEGDFESLKILAKENGLDPEDAQDYFDGALPYLCTDLIAAMGKLQVEENDLKPKNIMKDWTNYIRTLVSEDLQMRTALRKKGKSLKGCMGYLLKWSFEHMDAIDSDIKKAAGINQQVKLGIPGITKAKTLIREYYLGGTK